MDAHRDNQPPDEGLVRIYTDKTAGLGTRAMHGDDVRDDVRAVVKGASEQFEAVLGTSELSYLRTFAGRLAVYATAAEASQPDWAATLTFAREVAQERIDHLEREEA